MNPHTQTTDTRFVAYCITQGVFPVTIDTLQSKWTYHFEDPTNNLHRDFKNKFFTRDHITRETFASSALVEFLVTGVIRVKRGTCEPIFPEFANIKIVS